MVWAEEKLSALAACPLGASLQSSGFNLSLYRTGRMCFCTLQKALSASKRDIIWQSLKNKPFSVAGLLKFSRYSLHTRFVKALLLILSKILAVLTWNILIFFWKSVTQWFYVNYCFQWRRFKFIITGEPVTKLQTLKLCEPLTAFVILIIYSLVSENEEDDAAEWQQERLLHLQQRKMDTKQRQRLFF